jgi:hypothetical protein
MLSCSQFLSTVKLMHTTPLPCLLMQKISSPLASSPTWWLLSEYPQGTIPGKLKTIAFQMGSCWLYHERARDGSISHPGAYVERVLVSVSLCLVVCEMRLTVNEKTCSGHLGYSRTPTHISPGPFVFSLPGADTIDPNS